MKNFYYIDKQSKKTLIFMQGGPINYNFMQENVDKNKINPMFWLYMDLVKEIPNLFNEYNVASVNQAQYKNPENITSSKEEALSLLNETLEIMDKTINHFRGLGHEILLLGHSYGGYLISEYLKEYGNDKVDNIVIANSRIKTPILFTDFITNKRQVPLVSPKDEIVGFWEDGSDPLELKLIMAITMERDYCKELSHINLSNVIYLSSYPDMILGIMQKDEVVWAKSKGAKIIETNLHDLKDFYKMLKKTNVIKDILSHNSIFFQPIVDKIKKQLKNTK